MLADIVWSIARFTLHKSLTGYEQKMSLNLIIHNIFLQNPCTKKTAKSNREEVLVLAKRGIYDGASFVRGKIYPGENICPWVVKRRGTT